MNSPEMKPEHHESDRGFIARLGSYVLAGILITVPTFLTLYFFLSIINMMDRWIAPLIPEKYHPENYLPISLPGLGLVLTVTTLALVGFLATNFIGRYFIRLSEQFMERVPFLRSVYGAVKQILETILANQSNAFRKVVLVEYPRTGVWVIGFLTGKTSEELQSVTEAELVNVFVPTTPNPTSGFLLFVPKEQVVELEMPVEDGLKLVISGGIVGPKDKTAVVI